MERDLTRNDFAWNRHSLRYSLADALGYAGTFVAMYTILQHPMDKPTPIEFLAAIVPTGICALVYTCGEISDLVRLAKNSKKPNLKNIK